MVGATRREAEVQAGWLDCFNPILTNQAVACD